MNSGGVNVQKSMDSSLKEDIHKIQIEINKLNDKFEKEISVCECKQPGQIKKKKANSPTEKKLKKPFIVSKPQNIMPTKKIFTSSITPKVLFFLKTNEKNQL